MEPAKYLSWVGRDVVVDTSTSYLYIGTLSAADDYFLTIAGADVHDCAESSTTKELYVLEARKFGIRKNRASVLVRLDKVVSLSLLEDVIVY